MKPIRINIVFALAALLPLFTSCLDQTGSKVNYSDDAKITRFYLSSNVNPTLSKQTFIVDEKDKRIYTPDSLDFGSRVDSAYFVCSPLFQQIIVDDILTVLPGEKNQDTLYYDFSKPVKLTVFSKNNKKEASYMVETLVHQVDPDTFIWEGSVSQIFPGVSVSERAFFVNERFVYLVDLGGALHAYVSENAVVWNDHAVVGLDDVEAVDFSQVVSDGGYLYLSDDSRLYKSSDGFTWTSQPTSGAVSRLLYCLNGELFGANFDDRQLVRLAGSEWQVVTMLPQPFPVRGAAICVEPAPSDKPRVFIMGGEDAGGNLLSTLWSSENSTYWSNLNVGAAQFSARTEVALAQYADGLMVFGGRDGAGVVKTGNLLFSQDYGINWSVPEQKMILPSLYVRRYGASVVTTPSGHIYLIGGRTAAGNSISDVWHGVRYASIPGFKR